MTITHKVMKGDTRTPFGAILYQGGKPIDLAGVTVKVYGLTYARAAWITEGITGITVHPTNTFTADADTDKLKHNGSKVKAGDEIVLTTTGTLPAGLATSTRYFVINVEPNAWQVSLKPDGPAVAITDAGSGTHSYYIVGSVQYDFQTADVATAGQYRLWLRPFDSSERDTFPNDNEGILVYVEETET